MPVPKMTPAMQEEAARLREENGWSITRIAHHFRVSAGTVSWHLLKLGADSPACAVKVTPQTAPGPAIVLRNGYTVRHFTPSEDEAILRLEAQGLSPTAIGRQMFPQRRPNSIRARLMTLARHDARREAALASLSRGMSGADGPVHDDGRQFTGATDA